MGIEDKAEHSIEDMAGKVKEVAGHQAGDDGMTAEGEEDQSSVDVKKAGESVKDVVQN